MDKLDALVAAFNRGSLDVPSGFLTPRTTYSLNDRSYETILGGSPDDPLIRLLARGAGGYRMAAKALQYAMGQPTATVESLTDPDQGGVCVAGLRVEGRLRDSGEPFVWRAALRLTCNGVELSAVDVRCVEEDLARIALARQPAATDS